NRHAVDSRKLLDVLNQAVDCLGAGADPFDRVDLAVLELQDRANVEQRAKQGTGAADPSAALEVLQRIHEKMDVDVWRQLPDEGDDLTLVGTGTSGFRRCNDDQSQPKARGPRVDDLDVAVGTKRVRGHLRRMQSSAQLGRDVDRNHRAPISAQLTVR